MIKNICAFIIIILIINSCSEAEKKSSKFSYNKGESSVELKIINGNDYLIYNTPTRVDFEWVNIDPKTSLIYGSGIKILVAKENVTQTEISVPNNYLKNDSLNIKLSFEIDGEKLNTEFNVPMKNDK